MSNYTTKIYKGDYLAIRDKVVEIYASTYTKPPYNETDEQVQAFKKSWNSRVETKGFRLVVSETSDKEVIGMAYGWESVRGDSWNNSLRAQLGNNSNFWLDSCFEFVDISVKPEHHGQKVGSALLNTLFKGLYYKTSLLLTHQSVTSASKMYTKKGWKLLKEDFEISPGNYFVIMGKELD